MNPLPQILEDSEKEFDEKFLEKKLCIGCGKNPCDYGTTGCPNYYDNIIWNKKDGGFYEMSEQIKLFLHSHLQSAYKAGLERAMELKPVEASGLLVGEFGSKAIGWNQAIQEWENKINKEITKK